MNWFQKQFRKVFPVPEKRQELKHIDWLHRNYPHSLYGNDYTITYENSLAVSYAYAAISGISTDISSVKWPVLFKDGNRIEERMDYDVWTLLNERSSFLFSSNVWLKTWVANYLATGDGFTEIIRDGRGRPVELRLHHKHDIEAYVDYDNSDRWYEVKNDKNRKIDYMDMLHLSDLSYDGVLGYSKIGLAKQSLEIYKRSDNTQKEYQENATMLSGVVTTAGTLDDEALRLLRETWDQTYSGSKGGVGFLEGGQTFTPFDYTMNLADLEFIGSRKFTGEEILRWFRYPAHMAGNLDRMTDNNIEQISIEYVNYCLRPIVKLMEQEINYKLIRIKDRPQTYVKAQLKSLLRGDIETRMMFYETMWKIGAMTPNMALDLEDMNPVPGGDVTYADLNKIPTDQVKEYYQSKINLNNSKADDEQLDD